MRELSLFSGAGGGLLGTKLLDWRCIGYVETNDYCQQVLRGRINDGHLDPAPIFGDIKTFLTEGYARSYQGLADVITAGFPCQPWSVAGRRQGTADDRNLWPQTLEVVRQVEPVYVLLENVPGLKAKPYFGTILRQLATSGYGVRWDCVSASSVGANHQRDRLWILANPQQKGLEKQQQQLVGKKLKTSQRNSDSGGWWLSEPAVGQVAHGVAKRVDRLKALGNGQVPAVVKEVWKLMS